MVIFFTVLLHREVPYTVRDPGSTHPNVGLGHICVSKYCSVTEKYMLVENEMQHQYIMLRNHGLGITCYLCLWRYIQKSC